MPLRQVLQGTRNNAFYYSSHLLWNLQALSKSSFNGNRREKNILQSARALRVSFHHYDKTPVERLALYAPFQLPETAVAISSRDKT
jgi:hypothetical protein